MKKLLIYAENDEYVLEHINSFGHSFKRYFITEQGLNEELEMYDPVIENYQIINQL